jgi:hypothetical protein
VRSFLKRCFEREGLSLVEASVAMGLLALLALAFSSLLTNSMQGKAMLEASSDFGLLTSQIKTVTDHQCAGAFRNSNGNLLTLPGTFPQTPLANGYELSIQKILYGDNTLIDQASFSRGALKISSLKFTQFIVPSGNAAAFSMSAQPAGTEWENILLTDSADFNLSCEYRFSIGGNTNSTYLNNGQNYYYANGVTSNWLVYISHSGLTSAISSNEKTTYKVNGSPTAGYTITSIQKRCSPSVAGGSQYYKVLATLLIEGMRNGNPSPGLKSTLILPLLVNQTTKQIADCLPGYLSSPDETPRAKLPVGTTISCSWAQDMGYLDYGLLNNAPNPPCTQFSPGAPTSLPSPWPTASYTPSHLTGCSPGWRTQNCHGATGIDCCVKIDANASP